MKAVLILSLVLAFSAHAQIQEPPPTFPVPPPPVVETSGGLRSETELDALLAPIALYPDALIALILPASTTPADIVLAARHLTTSGATAAQTLADKPWDDSIKALIHYPDLLRWLDQNLPWTQSLGDTFSAQPADVMDAVQRLRQQARAAGTLVDTPQQQVVAENNTLLIVPAQPDVVYLPVYDPAVVYVSHSYRSSYGRPYFRAACPTGPWLNYRPHWRAGHVRVINDHHHGRPHHLRDAHPSTPGHVWVSRHHNRTRDSRRNDDLTADSRDRDQRAPHMRAPFTEFPRADKHPVQIKRPSPQSPQASPRSEFSQGAGRNRRSEESASRNKESSRKAHTQPSRSVERTMAPKASFSDQTTHRRSENRRSESKDSNDSSAGQRHGSRPAAKKGN